MPRVPKTITAPVSRVGAAAQNALEVARFGGLATDDEPSPYEVMAEERVFKLRRYYPGTNEGAPAVVLVPPLMLAADVYDVSRRSSAVTILHEHGIDPWVIDFGAPEREKGGLERTLGDHVLAVSEAVDRVRDGDRPRRSSRWVLAGRHVRLPGRRPTGATTGSASLITFGSPVDTRQGAPFGIPGRFAGEVAEVLALAVPGRRRPGLVQPQRLSACSIRSSRARNRIDFLLQLHDREALLPRERQRRFLEADGWVAWPGPALAEFVNQFVAHNRMLEGGFVIEDRLLSLADIAVPVLSVVGTVDDIAPAGGVRAIRQAAPRADVYELDAARRPLRSGRRVALDHGDMADGGGLGALAIGRRGAAGERQADPGRRRASSSRRRCATASATGWSSPTGVGSGWRGPRSAWPSAPSRGARELVA